MVSEYEAIKKFVEVRLETNKHADVGDFSDEIKNKLCSLSKKYSKLEIKNMMLRAIEEYKNV